jgi:hypothetical protein
MVITSQIISPRKAGIRLLVRRNHEPWIGARLEAMALSLHTRGRAVLPLAKRILHGVENARNIRLVVTAAESPVDDDLGAGNIAGGRGEQEYN